MDGEHDDQGFVKPLTDEKSRGMYLQLYERCIVLYIDKDSRNRDVGVTALYMYIDK